MTASRQTDASGYHYGSPEHSHTEAYILPSLEKLMADEVSFRNLKQPRLFELGCGNGALAAHLHRSGYDVTAVDPSVEGIRVAKANFHGPRFEEGSAYDDLASSYGTFPIVVSLEVVEHVYAPRSYAATLFALVEPGGLAVLSTPYHGYLKNLVLAVAGRMDQHYGPLWDHGHIKFWSRDTLKVLLMEAGFVDIRYRRVGRIPVLAKSLIAAARRP